jgi:hypothetical protein
LIKVTATHTSKDEVIRHVDKQATFIDLGGIYRITYKEESGALMVLDISDSWVQFKREDTWTTHAIFHKHEPSKLYIVSEEGELRFDIEVSSIQRSTQGVVVDYVLLQADVEDRHRYECEWIKEETTWQGNH